MRDTEQLQQFLNAAQRYFDAVGEPAKQLDHHTRDGGGCGAPREAVEKSREALKHFRTANSSSDINTMFPAVYDARECVRNANNINRELHPDNPRETDFEGEYDAELNELLGMMDSRLMSLESVLQPVYDSQVF